MRHPYRISDKITVSYKLSGSNEIYKCYYTENERTMYFEPTNCDVLQFEADLQKCIEVINAGKPVALCENGKWLDDIASNYFKRRKIEVIECMVASYIKSNMNDLDAHHTAAFISTDNILIVAAHLTLHAEL